MDMGTAGMALGGAGSLVGAIGGMFGGKKTPEYMPGTLEARNAASGQASDMWNLAGSMPNYAQQYQPQRLTSNYFNQLDPYAKEALVSGSEALSGARGLSPYGGAETQDLEKYIANQAQQRTSQMMRGIQDRYAAAGGGGGDMLARQQMADTGAGINREMSAQTAQNRMAGQQLGFNQQMNRNQQIAQMGQVNPNALMGWQSMETGLGQAQNQVQQQLFGNSMADEAFRNQMRQQALSANLQLGGGGPIGYSDSGGILGQVMGGLGGAAAGAGGAMQQYQFNQQLAQMLGRNPGYQSYGGNSSGSNAANSGNAGMINYGGEQPPSIPSSIPGQIDWRQATSGWAPGRGVGGGNNPGYQQAPQPGYQYPPGLAPAAIQPGRGSTPVTQNPLFFD